MPPDKRTKYRSVLDKLSKENAALENESTESMASKGVEDVFHALRARSEKWDANYGKKLEEKKEDTRNSLGNWIIKTFCLAIGGLALAGSYAALFQDEAHLKNFISVTQTIGALLSGAVGFVLGHYFTNKEK